MSNNNSNHTSLFTDDDGDSHMALSVASSVPTDLVHPATPTSQPAVLDDLSPPSSQGGVSLYPSTPAAPGNPSMPSVAASASGANANGKRPLETLDGIAESTLASSEGGTAVAQTQPQIRAQQIHTHDASGYTWTKPEHAPGYAWSNRKAVEEAARAWETGVVAKERAIKNRYGDPLETADREAAMQKTISAAAAVASQQ